VNEILKTPDMVGRLADLGAVPGGERPDQFAVFIQAEIAKWSKVTRDAGITVE
jgi:tripartite-type tricarboxylate transporter receptor subunit TctC